jgi:hypothetical protein
VANEVAGQDLSWFFTQAVEGTDALDYEVSRATSVRASAAAGFFDAATGRTFIGQDADEGSRDGARTYTSRVTVRRRGGFAFPVEIALKFEGLPVERVTWDGRDRWKQFRYERPERLEWADVDPDRKILLDANWLNNGRRIEPDLRPAAHWAARLAFWLQNLFATVGW